MNKHKHFNKNSNLTRDSIIKKKLDIFDKEVKEFNLSFNKNSKKSYSNDNHYFTNWLNKNKEIEIKKYQKFIDTLRDMYENDKESFVKKIIDNTKNYKKLNPSEFKKFNINNRHEKILWGIYGENSYIKNEKIYYLQFKPIIEDALGKDEISDVFRLIIIKKDLYDFEIILINLFHLFAYSKQDKIKEKYI